MRPHESYLVRFIWFWNKNASVLFHIFWQRYINAKLNIHITHPNSNFHVFWLWYAVVCKLHTTLNYNRKSLSLCAWYILVLINFLCGYFSFTPSLTITNCSCMRWLYSWLIRSRQLHFPIGGQIKPYDFISVADQTQEFRSLSFTLCNSLTLSLSLLVRVCVHIYFVITKH